MNASDAAFWDAVDEIRDRDDRLHREAYGFVLAALGWAVRHLPDHRRDDPARRHLTGAELVAAMATLARREFGVIAATVFREWGIRSNEDIGRLVFQLVESRRLSARPEDSMQDFLAAADVFETLGDERAPLGTPRPGGDETLPER